MTVQFDEWVDLTRAGMDLKVVRVPRGNHYYVVRDTGGDMAEGMGVRSHAEALTSLGFRSMPGKEGLRLRECVVDPDSAPVRPLAASEFMASIPGAVSMPYDPARDYVDQRDPAAVRVAQEALDRNRAFRDLARGVVGAFATEIEAFSKPARNRRANGNSETASRRLGRLVANAVHEMPEDRVREALEGLGASVSDAALAAVPEAEVKGPRAHLRAALRREVEGRAQQALQQRQDGFARAARKPPSPAETDLEKARRNHANNARIVAAGIVKAPVRLSDAPFAEWPDLSRLGMRLTLVRKADDEFLYEVSDIVHRLRRGEGVASNASMLAKLDFRLPRADIDNATVARMRAFAEADGSPIAPPSVEGFRFIAGVHGIGRDLIAAIPFDEGMHFEDRRPEASRIRNPSLPGNPSANSHLPGDRPGDRPGVPVELVWDQQEGDTEAMSAPRGP